MKKKQTDPLLDPLHKVIGDWGVVEFVLCVIFFPLSLIYIGFRLLQEMSNEEED